MIMKGANAKNNSWKVSLYDNPEGKELLGRLKSFALEVLMRERDE
jgi:hypothetical protein